MVFHSWMWRRWTTDIYDKREHPPLSRINSLKYPHPSSFLSVRSKYGIVTSRMCHYSRICSSRSAFVARARLFLAEFCARGYPRGQVSRMVLRFLKSTPLSFAVRSPVSLMRELMAAP